VCVQLLYSPLSPSPPPPPPPPIPKKTLRTQKNKLSY